MKTSILKNGKTSNICEFIGIIMLGGLLFSSCGKDGDDGDIYLAIFNKNAVYSYWDDNPGIPYGFTYGRYYYCSPRVYSYEYESENYRHWGTYT